MLRYVLRGGNGETGMTIEVDLGNKLRERGWTLATAESCSGGLISHRITNVSGSSRYFLGGVVSYSNGAKVKLLNVRPESLESYGAVSEQVAREMAEGARNFFGADLALAVTGIAGPGGGTAEKPVGLVYMAVASTSGTKVDHRHFRGDRESIKAQTADHALNLLMESLAP